MAAVDASSLRAAALEIGVSFSGLRSFLLGGTPYVRTQRLLTAWYVRTCVGDADGVEPRGEEVDTATTAAAALDGLVAHLPAAQRRIVTNAVLQAISTATADAAVPQPQWLTTLLKRDADLPFVR
jgi:hypothetical protein